MTPPISCGLGEDDMETPLKHSFSHTGMLGLTCLLRTFSIRLCSDPPGPKPSPKQALHNPRLGVKHDRFFQIRSL